MGIGRLSWQEVLGLIRKGGALVVPGAFDAASALLVEKAGFKAFYVSGAGCRTPADCRTPGCSRETRSRASPHT